MKNPLLGAFILPPFSAILPEHIVPAVARVIADHRAQVESVLSQSETFTWCNLCRPLDEVADRLMRVWSPINHLHSVKNSPEQRDAYEQAALLMAEHETWLGQHEDLYQAYYKFSQSENFAKLSLPQRKAVEDKLRTFKLSGVGLAVNQKKRYGEITIRLSELKTKYENNVLDATMGWSKLIENVSELKGLPENFLAQAKIKAQNNGLSGWLLTLDAPSYTSITTYADNRQLREEIFHAYMTRASDQGPNADKWDNSKVMAEVLALRHESALLLGFATYAEYSLATKMANNSQQVIEFLTDLAKRAHPQGKEELAQLIAFVEQQYGVVEPLEPWDIPYYSEKHKQHLYAINDEQLRPYFPEPRVLSGLFEVVRRIYGMYVKERQGVDTWHPDVRFFDVFDVCGTLRGSFYLDLYARENKRGGAWMDDCVSSLRKPNHEALQKPVAYLTCNFNRPLGDQPALFTHKEVNTLFHEFGHTLHHILTRIETAGVAGINGVPWDAVEFPSQFMEYWAWEPEALSFISGHYQTGETLPQEMLESVLSAKNYHSALAILRQLEFGLFDFRIHAEYSPEQEDRILTTLSEVKKSLAVVPAKEWERFPHAFNHIFAGGYAAGYYSYLWAEVLAADAYSRFEEEGIFNDQTGASFLNNILSRGGSEDPMVLFKHFRGREPNLDAMLRHSGIKG